MIHISENLTSEMSAHALRLAPNECCGLLIGTRSGEERAVSRIYEATNIERNSPATRYLIDPEDFHAADKSTWNTEEEIIGFYHSHPKGPAQPSAFDAEQASLWPGYCYLILDLSGGELREIRAWVWEGTSAKFEPADLEIE